MYPKNDSDCGARQLVERRIVRSLVDEILEQGLSISVYDGEETHPVTSDREKVLEDLINTDEDYVMVFSGQQKIGWVRLVYGNEGWDVICDYTVNLEDKMTRTQALIDELS